ncbi:GTPase ObgE [endosymbiont 'TC1' of Trimyema compressum]|uniref:GTPase ObgE n=1 Tax=endosymbiont 'TC1' of Trimyema compressum TaxID=243899 RepID=UPI0007F09863|nr:GTPase ObgE [endosymbiont 'TC1' of Trimyema compressum]AMP20748.1 GTPase ObgE [endosymbiont 'TC1' of Trimyema compressum]
MFYDKVRIFIKGGYGGNGMVSFRREKYVPEGGPSGGDGGLGGSVFLVGDKGATTMIDFKYKKHHKAAKGENGKTSNMHGRNGQNLYLKVPLGTIVKDELGNVLADIIEDGQEVCVAAGGRGGRGNARFMSNKNKAPRMAENGEPGDEKTIYLELKLLADAGIAGYPNAGKSTLISSVSNARPKIGDYPFTTLNPHLGVVSLGDKSFVLADIPGLIDGASEGIGLGHQFLKHLERTKVIVHLLDAGGFDEERDLFEDYTNINKELALFNEALGRKKQIIAVNKIDASGAEEKAEIFIKKLRESGVEDPVFKISAVTRQGLEPFLYEVLKWVKEIEAPIIATVNHKITQLEDDLISVEIEPLTGIFILKGYAVDRAFKMAYLASDEGIRHFHQQLVRIGAIELLKEKGVQAGDAVRIGKTEFDYVD